MEKIKYYEVIRSTNKKEGGGFKMQKKVVGIFIVLLMISSAMTTILFSDKVKVEASGGGQQGGGDINLDYDWVWERVQDFGNVIHNVNWSEGGENDIPKGRCWATAGEDYTRHNIIYPYMGAPNNPCGLMNYTNLSIRYLSGEYGLEPETNKPKQYSSKIVIHDFYLTIHNNNTTWSIPYSELFPIGVGRAPILSDPVKYLNYTFNFSNCPIIPLDLSKNYYIDDHKNVSSQLQNNYDVLTGPIVYLNSTETVPENQDCVFIMNEEQASEDKLDNITDAIGCILINDSTKAYTFNKGLQYNFTITKVNGTDNNFSAVLSEIQNGSNYVVDNLQNNRTLVFSNYSNASSLPPDDFVFFCSIGLRRRFYHCSNLRLFFIFYTYV
jgi:hypothetical protein